MLVKVLKSKIHRATVTQADVNYTGSIGIDRTLCEKVGLVPGEMVLVADITNGARLETYVQIEEPGSGTICMNGAAAKLIDVGDLVIIMGFAYLTSEESKTHQPCVVVVDEKNRISKTL
ncbi:MAG: aspartate 1-decarboxylase [Phycisphaerae bacterium]|nr:aspartate 1-decarboxylase [Phycisphaerae bacterium]